MPEKKYDINSAVAVILSKVSRIESDLDKVNTKLESNYVTVEAFDPVKKLVYGMVSVILLAVIGAIVAIVLK